MEYEVRGQVLLYDELKSIEWVLGKHVRLATLLYRHAIVVACSSRGRQRAQFSNGDFPYAVYVEVVDKHGNWSGRGSNVVPVLPDGRLLMVVEQRPILARYPAHQNVVALDNGRTFDLGETGSLEFPGGSIETGESITLGALRELGEETEVPEQRVLLYRKVPPTFHFSSDLASANFYAVVHLSQLKFEGWVENDGGLRVLALTEAEVRRNIETGAIASGQAGLLVWGFYREVIEAVKARTIDDLIAKDYISKELVQLKK